MEIDAAKPTGKVLVNIVAQSISGLAAVSRRRRRGVAYKVSSGTIRDVVSPGHAGEPNNAAPSSGRKFLRKAESCGFHKERCDQGYTVYHAGKHIGTVPFDKKRLMALMLSYSFRENKSMYLTLANRWPYHTAHLSVHYDTTGNRKLLAPPWLPCTFVEALVDGRKPGGCLELGSALVRLWRNLKQGPSADPREAINILDIYRRARLSLRDGGRRSKYYMTLGSKYSNTYMKFYNELVGRCYHPGSGKLGCLSRLASVNASESTFVDPASNVPLECRGYQLEEIAEHDFVVSDVCAYDEAGLEPEATNAMAFRIIQYCAEQGKPFIVKVGLSERIPSFLRDRPIFSLHSKVRLHNAEIVVANGSETLEAIMGRVAHVVIESNKIRGLIDTGGRVPSLKPYEEALDIYPAYNSILFQDSSYNPFVLLEGNNVVYTERAGSEKQVKVFDRPITGVVSGGGDYEYLHIAVSGLTMREACSLYARTYPQFTAGEVVSHMKAKAYDEGFECDAINVVFE